ncbi:hypothetical protein [Streptomyces sp. NPDC059979]|uniref:hypothetical protein n=1 Tax=Streptomyces sp. NPDC059979 TaxID=3347021 RepID=UPI00368AE951
MAHPALAGARPVHPGYLRFDTSVMVVTVLVLIALVQSAQLLGNAVSRKVLRR